MTLDPRFGTMRATWTHEDGPRDRGVWHMSRSVHCMNACCQYSRISRTSNPDARAYDPELSTASEFPHYFCSQGCEHDFLANQLQAKLFQLAFTSEAAGIRS